VGYCNLLTLIKASNSLATQPLIFAFSYKGGRAEVDHFRTRHWPGS